MKKARVHWIISEKRWVVLSPMGWRIHTARELDEAVDHAVFWMMAYRSRGAL